MLDKSKNNTSCTLATYNIVTYCFITLLKIISLSQIYKCILSF